MKMIRSRLAPIETASFCVGVQHKRYSVERDKTSYKTKNVLLLKIFKIQNINKINTSGMFLKSFIVR